MDNSFKIAELIAKKVTGNISSSESEFLENWINESPENKAIFENSIHPKTQLQKLEQYHSIDKQKIWDNIDKKISGPTVISFQRILLRVAAVLLPLIILVGITYQMFVYNNDSLATIDERITPGSQTALLILSDGKSIDLDHKDTQNEFQEKGITIKNEKEQLSYGHAESDAATKQLVFNELRTPRGGNYKLKLADGTEVWLNSASSLRFPVEFTDSTRVVYLTGEAFFNVSHNGKPFIVNAKNTDIHVLGTSFNVNAYSNEAYSTTTLVEGKVRIETKNTAPENRKNIVLTPGEQSRYNKTDEQLVVEKVNPSQYISWTEGKIEFTNQPLDVVMRRLARWYDFEYSFENEAARNYHFSVRINNTENISTILEMLELTTDVSFAMKDETIVIQ